jgi:5-formyltetrahydrofolate cyclo-ligase
VVSDDPKRGSPEANDRASKLLAKPDLRALRARKARLRAQMREMRQTLPNEEKRSRSRAICERVVQSVEFARARTVVAYVAMDEEADPAAILERAHDQGKIIGLPRVAVRGGLLAFRQWKPGDPLVRGNFGLQEPAVTAALLEPCAVDLMLVPAVAVDEHGYRVGSGGGYYDRLLATCPSINTMALIYDFQLVSDLPVAEGDMAVRSIVTDQRLIFIKLDKITENL